MILSRILKLYIKLSFILFLLVFYRNEICILTFAYPFFPQTHFLINEVIKYYITDPLALQFIKTSYVLFFGSYIHFQRILLTVFGYMYKLYD